MLRAVDRLAARVARLDLCGGADVDDAVALDGDGGVVQDAAVRVDGDDDGVLDDQVGQFMLRWLGVTRSRAMPGQGRRASGSAR